MSTASYDDIAEWYDALVREAPIYREVILPGLIAMIGDVRGQQVCDLACGQGLMTRELARRGARVTGVDLSPRLLAFARRYEEESPMGIRYIQDDAQSLASLDDAAFDGATCSMGLINIPDLAATLQAVRRVLKTGGWFALSITHPCFEAPHARWVEKGDGIVVREIREYFDEKFWYSSNPNGLRGRVGDYHRPLSTYVNGLVDAGFALERIAEPRATGQRAEQVPGNRTIPSIMLMRARAVYMPGPGH